MRENELNRDDNPPVGRKVLTLVRLKAGQAMTCRIVSVNLWGLWTHWTGSASEPCFRDDKKCDGCKKGFPARWKAWLHVVNVENRRQVFLELTSTCASILLDQAPDRKNLRGLRVTFTRSKGADNGRLRCELLDASVNGLTLPDPLDPLDTLKTLWRVPQELDRLQVVA